ncbi:ARM repeat-containing protein [Russula earlei]|uniref:ARM repeat-containing protein n=1 Tax=Russula earlei TaxID=71964 RepID=A0ACC0UAA7_9AGAM|nr:ARM repeat-containing protein [Russula earlei]
MLDDMSDGSSDPSFVWRRDIQTGEWMEALAYASRQLLVSRTSVRIAFMLEDLLPFVKKDDLSSSQVLDVFELLIQMYTRYADSASRGAVQTLAMELVRHEETRGQRRGITEQILDRIANEVSRIAKHPGAHAPTSLFALLCWCCSLYAIVVHYSSISASSPSWKSLATSMAILLDLLLQASTRAKSSVRKSAAARTRRALRSSPAHLPGVMNTLLAQSKTLSSPLIVIPLLGIAVDVTLHIKGVEDVNLSSISEALKIGIITLHSNTVLMARTHVPSHITTSLTGFIETLTDADLQDSILPTMEKALLRSPEYSLSVTSEFFLAYPHPVSIDAFRRILVPIFSCAKSTNAEIRTNSVHLFKITVERATEEGKGMAFTELLKIAQAGKAVGPDRKVLYTMFNVLSTSAQVSPSIVESVPALLAKETNEAALATLASSLAPHVVFHLRENLPIPDEAVKLFIAQMQNSKPIVRRAFVSLVGEAFWALGDLKTASATTFARAVVNALESSLKTVATNPLNASAGPLEGYVAAAILLGPFSRSGVFEVTISQNATVQAILSLSKPSFLAWDKVYQKLTDFEEETWLLRALKSTVTFFNVEVAKAERLRVQLGLAYLYLATESRLPEFRRLVVVSVEHLAALIPKTASELVRAALAAHLASGHRATLKNPSTSEDEKPVISKQPRLLAFLAASAAFGEDTEVILREQLLAESIVLAHHPEICGNSRQVWIELCRKARIDPRAVLDNQLDNLLKIVNEPLAEGKVDSADFAEAYYRATTTLAFVAPDKVLPRIMEQLRANLGPAINSLTELDFGVWITPEGQTFIDVLSNKGNKVQAKGKDADLAKWDAEVRQTLAKKTTAPPTLSKQQQSLVQAQIEKEAKIRSRVSEIKANLDRALQTISHLTMGNIYDLRAYVSQITSLLLRSGALDKGTLLVGSLAFRTFLDVSRCCSDRLITSGKWIGIATLRSLEIGSIPEELQAEPVNQLVLRVLHRLRSLSEQTPLDPATFSYAFPLLLQVIQKGGIESGEGDEPLEQVALSLDIIKFHCGEFADPAFPRSQVIHGLLHAMRTQPKLSKESSSALIDLGQAISPNATSEETTLLLDSTLVQEAYARNVSLQALQPFDLTEFDWIPELFIACHDSDAQNARLARHIWEDNGLDVVEAYTSPLLNLLEHDNAYVRSSSAAAFVEAIERWPASATETIDALMHLYREKAKILAPEFDQYGIVDERSLGRLDPWQARLAIAQTLEHLAPAFSEEVTVPFFDFLVKEEALGDRSAEVRRGMLDAGSAIIDHRGSRHLAELITMIETHLAGPPPTSETADVIHEALVILFGRIARHLDSSDTRLPTILARLVKSLKTPSEQVQYAVADCLAPLIKVTRSSAPQLANELLDELFNAQKYAARRGAAYGLAGVVRGLGISAMKEFNVFFRVKSATEDKKQYEPRQGAMFALETLSSTLERLFEPYAIHALPLLLAAFGDSVSDVREAATDAARIIMKNMSGYGVKLILPSLLSGLDEKQWRTKKGSIELMGMMAYCAPRQLSQSLPIIIPRLTGVLTDSHAQVRTAANRSLKQFGEVISNPEVQALVPVFLKAMVDPAKTPNALTALLKTSFVHYIDHSSLALVIPILERGLRERSADTKKKAAQIVGNLASLTDSKDFVPYLSTLMPMLHVVLVDPVPEARATAAKSLGTLVERLGEVNFPDLVPSLIRTLKTDTSGVDRQGAAQGLSEVLSGLGMERLESLLPDIISNAQSPRSTIREGFMSLLVFLPATFGARFQPHLPKVITPILKGLSDAEDYVREAAMRAGRMVITNYSSKAIELLLPELEHGMFDPAWRIRQSSITLVGELLFKVSGIASKLGIDDDPDAAEAIVAESSRKALTEVLGADRRDRILSALYLARQDAVHIVRQSSIQIWKALVHNTPKTVREILPELVTQLMSLLSSEETEQQETGVRTTGELCKKFGERILGEMVKILRTKSSSPDAQTREGVCLLLSELMTNSTDTQQEGYEDEIISMIRTSLVDDETNVRAAAARAFDILQGRLGAKAIDQTIPTLLEALRQPGESSGTALQALKEVMNVRANTVFPVLIPTLIATPMTVFNARALASLVTVAGNALSKRLTVVLSALVKITESTDDTVDEELRTAVDEAVQALLGSIPDVEGLNTLMLLLLGWVKHEAPERRVSGCRLFKLFCEVSELDASLYRVDWVRQLVSSMDDRIEAVYVAAWDAFDAFVKSVPKDDLDALVVPLRRTIESVGVPGVPVPGFSLPKGISAFVPIIITGLTTGSNEQRENAAYAISDLVERTSEVAIKPFVVPFTGPLIRVATQAGTFPPAVKTALLCAMETMLLRIPALVKPFFPQLQRTFIKSTSDPASVVVRTKAAQALGQLMRHQPRVDPVVTELITGAKSNDDVVASSFVLALSYVVKSAGENVGGTALEASLELVSDAFRELHDEYYVQSTAALFAALSTYGSLVDSVVRTYLMAGTPPSVLASHCIVALLATDTGAPPTTVPRPFQTVLPSIAQKIKESIGTEKPNIARPAREAKELLRNLDDSLFGQ